MIFDDVLERLGEQKWYPKGGILGAKVETKSIPKRLKIEVNFQERNKHSSRPSWEHLEAILSRSWEPSWVTFLILAEVLQWFRENELL